MGKQRELTRRANGDGVEATRRAWQKSTARPETLPVRHPRGEHTATGRRERGGGAIANNETRATVANNKTAHLRPSRPKKSGNG